RTGPCYRLRPQHDTVLDWLAVFILCKTVCIVCRNVYAVWRSYLKGTVQVTQSRINVCDNYKNEISDPARTVRLCKEQQLNKSIEQLNRIQVELQDSVKDLAKAKKKYYDSEQVAQAVREKADIEAK
uniref:Uncharacterized protein n=1 Tax=Hucho hucho TaxID=62062 RepID=A0A4W5LE80_9TELE